jgi:hypothetical protein
MSRADRSGVSTTAIRFAAQDKQNDHGALQMHLDAISLQRTDMTIRYCRANIEKAREFCNGHVYRLLRTVNVVAVAH